MKKDGPENVLQKKINQTKRCPFFSIGNRKVKGKLLPVIGHDNREGE
jgi:hypothetical protein